MQEQLMTSNRDDYETPDSLFREVDNIFKFSLDAAANNYNTKCNVFITETQNALIVDWKSYMLGQRDLQTDTVWVNPPYGNLVLPFFKKIKEEYDKGLTIVCLVAARTETKWAQIAWDYARYFLFFNKRLKFKLNGVSQGTATFPSELIVFSPRRWNLHSLQHLGKIIEQNVVTQKELLTLP